MRSQLCGFVSPVFDGPDASRERQLSNNNIIIIVITITINVFV